MKARIWIGVVVVACVIGVLAMLWPFSKGAPVEVDPASAEAPVDTADAPVAEVAEKPIPRPAPSATLPSTNAPLSLIVDDLKRRAGAGDAAAGCRLAAEYALCAQLPHRQSEFDQWLTGRQRALELITEAATRQAAASHIALEMPRWEARVQQLEDHCRGVEVPGAPAIARLWRAAALGGNPVAMKQYASGNAFRWGNLLESLPELTTYRHEAERIGTAAAQRGDLNMLFSLAAAYAPEARARLSLLAQAIPPDPARAVALYRHIERALVRHGDGGENMVRQVRERLDAMSKELSSAQRARADTLDQEIATQWQAPVMLGVAALDISGSQRDVSRAWCSQ